MSRPTGVKPHAGTAVVRYCPRGRSWFVIRPPDHEQGRGHNEQKRAEHTGTADGARE